jgi:peptide/nickel transport system substrate-binding protein
MKVKYLIALSMVLPLAACSQGTTSSPTSTQATAAPAPSEATPVSGGQLTVGLDSEPSTLDPMLDSGYASSQVKKQIFDPLFNILDDGTIEPVLAESFVQSDPTHVTITLRDGVLFQDGTPFDAAAVKVNLDRMKSDESSWKSDLDVVTEVNVIDPKTVEIVLAEPYGPLFSVLADQPGFMMSPTAIEKDGKSIGSQPVGTGPYSFKSWAKNDRIELVKNATYWQAGLPYLDAVTFRPISDPTVKITELASGQIQVVDYVPPQLVSVVEGNANLQYATGPANYGATVYVPMNPNLAPFDDPAVRQAMQMAIDRSSIVNNITFGTGIVSKSMIGESSWAFDSTLTEIPYDPEGAKKLLGGKTISFELQVPPTYAQEAQVIKDNLAKAGINADIVKMDWGQLLDNYFAGTFQAQIQDILGLTRSDPSGLLNGFFSSKGALNGTGAGSAEMDAMLDEAQSMTDQAERKAIYAKVLEQARADAYYTAIYNPVNNRAWTKGYEGLTPPANGLLNLREVWLAQ